VSARKPSKGLGRDAPIEERAPQIIRILSETYPDAKVALNFSSPLEMLVATILSAQCTDEKVNEVTETLFQKYRTAEDYLKVPEDELKADIKPPASSTRRPRRSARRAGGSSRCTAGRCRTRWRT
jgi:endonuclease III